MTQDNAKIIYVKEKFIQSVKHTEPQTKYFDAGWQINTVVVYKIASKS